MANKRERERAGTSTGSTPGPSSLLYTIYNVSQNQGVWATCPHESALLEKGLERLEWAFGTAGCEVLEKQAHHSMQHIQMHTHLLTCVPPCTQATHVHMISLQVSTAFVCRKYVVLEFFTM